MKFFVYVRYQTGALAPLIRWLSQGMQRAARPAQPPRPPAVRADNVPPPPPAVAGVYLLALPLHKH